MSNPLYKEVTIHFNEMYSIEVDKASSIVTTPDEYYASCRFKIPVENYNYFTQTNNGFMGKIQNWFKDQISAIVLDNEKKTININLKKKDYSGNLALVMKMLVEYLQEEVKENQYVEDFTFISKSPNVIKSVLNHTQFDELVSACIRKCEAAIKIGIGQHEDDFNVCIDSGDKPTIRYDDRGYTTLKQRNYYNCDEDNIDRLDVICSMKDNEEYEPKEVVKLLDKGEYYPKLHLECDNSSDIYWVKDFKDYNNAINTLSVGCKALYIRNYLNTTNLHETYSVIRDRLIKLGYKCIRISNDLWPIESILIPVKADIFYRLTRLMSNSTLLSNLAIYADILESENVLNVNLSGYFGRVMNDIPLYITRTFIDLIDILKETPQGDIIDSLVVLDTDTPAYSLAYANPKALKLNKLYLDDTFKTSEVYRSILNDKYGKACVTISGKLKRHYFITDYSGWNIYMDKQAFLAYLESDQFDSFCIDHLVTIKQVGKEAYRLTIADEHDIRFDIPAKRLPHLFLKDFDLFKSKNRGKL